MSERFKIDGEIFEAIKMTELAIDSARKIEFVDKRLKDYEQTVILLRQAKNTYIKSLKQELLNDKIGLIL